MPGSVSDSYDPEWGTCANRDEIAEAIQGVHDKLSGILDNRPPLYVLDLVRADLPTQHTATLTERDWRILRFCCERAKESL